MKHIGIVACSAEGAALCYQTICREALQLVGKNDHPRITMDSIPLAAWMPAFDAGDYRGVARFMLDSARVLAARRRRLRHLPGQLGPPGLGRRAGRDARSRGCTSRASVGAEAQQRGYRRVGVLGTRFTMDGPVYRDALSSMGIETMVPDADDFETVDRIIFSELVDGVFTDDSRQAYVGVIERLARARLRRGRPAPARRSRCSCGPRSRRCRPSTPRGCWPRPRCAKPSPEPDQRGKGDTDAKLRVHNLAMSLDGYVAGPDQSLDNPLGVGGERLHEWVFATRTGRRMIGEDGGDEGVDDDFIARGDEGIGATIMGRNMFGPIRGPWGDDDWTGWWGDDPPYHHPVFVLTHHPRPSITMEGGTTFHFVTDGIEAALERAFDAAGGQDVRLGGGAVDRPAVPPGRPGRRAARGDRARSCSAAASGSSTTSTVARTATSASSSSARPPSRTSASPGCRSRPGA